MRRRKEARDQERYWKQCVSDAAVIEHRKYIHKVATGQEEYWPGYWQR